MLPSKDVMFYSIQTTNSIMVGKKWDAQYNYSIA